MSHLHKIIVGKEQYNLVEATAPRQRELLSLIGGNLALRQATSGIEIDDGMIVGLLLSMSEKTLSRVSDIVLWKTVKNGTENIVSVDDFQGNMSGYLILVAGGIRSNLLDFFDYLQSASADARDESKE